MRKFSTIHELVLADIRELNARSKKHRKQRKSYATRDFIKQISQNNKRNRYRRDGVLLKLCDLNMKKILKEMTK